jgi:hypothetical protein
MSSFDLDSLKYRKMTLDPLDQPVYGAKAFGLILNRSERQVYGDLESGRLDGFVKKRGRQYSSTPRLLLASVRP